MTDRNPYAERHRLSRAMRMVDAAVAAGATPDLAVDIDWLLAADVAGVDDPSLRTIQLATSMLRDRAFTGDPLVGLPGRK